MDIDLDLLKIYLKSFFSKWYVVVFSSLGVLSTLFLYFTPSQKFLIIITIAISFIGIIASGYNVYRKLFNIIPEKYRLAYLPPKVGDPEIEIYQIGGKEYEFGYRDAGRNSYGLIQTNVFDELLPRMAGHFYFVISNVGYLPVDILSIKCDIEIYKPLHFTVPHAIESDNKLLEYPINLDIDEKVDITFQVSILPSSLLSEAEIAVNIRDFLDSKKTESLTVTLVMEDINKKKFNISKEFSFSPELLFNLYIENWRSKNAVGLLKLIEDK